MAFEPVLVQLLPEAVLVDDDDWFVLNKPAGARGAASAGARWDLVRAPDDVPGSIPAELVHANHGVDEAASGLVVVPRSVSARAQWGRAGCAAPVFDYLALVEPHPREPIGRIRRVDLGLDVSVVQRARACVLVRIRTRLADGRAVRTQMARAGVPVLGDTAHRARPAWRVMFHLENVHIPGAKLPRAPTPADFACLLSARGAEPRAGLERVVFEAMWRRRALAPNHDAYRLVNDEGDGLPGITVDRFGDWAMLSLAKNLGPDAESWLLQLLVRLGARGVYVKRRVRSDLRRCEVAALAPALPGAGDAAPGDIVVHEAGLRFWVALGEGLSCGLFVDQRDNRQRILHRVEHQQKMLNLFAYTCSFSVAAAKAGALATSVDLAAPALAWGRRNFELNGLDPSSHEFFRTDAMRWLDGARRHGRRYHWIVLDPPSFSTSGRGGAFSVEKDYATLASAAFSLLEPGGHLLAVTNHRKTTEVKFNQWIREAASSAGRRIASLEASPTPLDCPRGGDAPIPSKSLWVRVESA